MDNRDFEQYADAKRMIGQVAVTWENAFYEELKAKGLCDHSQVKFLDFGCGDGRYFPYLLTKGFLAENIHGVEVSQKRIDRCKELGWANARVLALNEPLPYQDRSFDVVNFVEVIEHIPSAERDIYLEEIARVMRPEAFLILTTPNYPMKRICDFIDAIWGGRWARLRDDPTHLCRYSKKKLERALSGHFS
ncbi:MAG: class I SAM-dependent methyltransferase, partial [Phycisphaerales bacterium]